MFRFLGNLLQLFGVVFLRFRWLPRLWCVWLVGVNLGCLWFITAVEGQVVLVVTVVAVVMQTILYGRLGFTRVMGTTHLMWLPMFAWLAMRLDDVVWSPDMRAWLAILLVTNLVSLCVDMTDLLRFVRGERTPHYVWKRRAV
jgi:hypothetical protein